MTRLTKVSTGGKSNTFIAAGILIVSVIAYVSPGRGSRRSERSIIAKGHTTVNGCQGRGSWSPSAKSCMAVLFVGLHACGLLSNSYISKFLSNALWLWQNTFYLVLAQNLVLNGVKFHYARFYLGIFGITEILGTSITATISSFNIVIVG